MGRGGEGGCGVAVGGSNILTREEEGRGEIILSSQPGKGSAATQRVRHGRGDSIITDILTAQKANSIRSPGETPSQQRGCTKHCKLVFLFILTEQL